MKKGSVIIQKVAYEMYKGGKNIFRLMAEELSFQASELKKNTEPLRIELRLMAIDQMEVMRRHVRPMADSLVAALKAQVRATRNRHRRKYQS